MRVDFKTAVLAKEKGFNEYVQGIINLIDKKSDYIGAEFGIWRKNSVQQCVLCNDKMNDFDFISQPTREELHNWLNINHKIEIFIELVGIVYFYKICINQINIGFIPHGFSSYKDAYNEALIRALNII